MAYHNGWDVQRQSLEVVQWTGISSKDKVDDQVENA